MTVSHESGHLTPTDSVAQTPVALVTGAARRIGATICQRLHDQGFNLVIHYHRSADDAQTLAESLNQQRANSVRCIQANLLELSELNTLAEQTVTAWGRLDLLVNNASCFYPTAITNNVTNTEERQWDELMGSNLKAPFFLSQALAPALAETQGSIINLVDIHGQKPLQDHAVYSIAKAGLIMLTQSLAKELAPRVRVNGIAPGAILWPEGPAHPSSSKQSQLLEKIPLGRLGNPDDIADALIFLAQQSYITGQILPVDGGKSLYS